MFCWFLSLAGDNYIVKMFFTIVTGQNYYVLSQRGKILMMLLLSLLAAEPRIKRSEPFQGVTATVFSSESKLLLSSLSSSLPSSSSSSSSSLLSLALTSVGKEQGHNLTLQTKGLNCDKVIHSTKAKNGTIETPNFPGPYPARTYCRYEFYGDGRERVQITFFEFSLPSEGDSFDCADADTLQVFIPTPKGRYEPIETLCGDTMPKPIMSNGPQLLLEFHGKQSGKGNRGLKAEYKFIENFGIISGKQLSDSECSFVYNSSEARGGWFHSPNFPGAYPRNIICNYYFHGEPNDKVFIRFTYFDVEGIFPCEESTASDFIEFSNFMSTDRKFRKLCGKRDGFIVRSDGKFFRITFRTNDRFDKTGFRASYSFEAESSTTEMSSVGQLFAASKSSGNVESAYSILQMFSVFILINIIIRVYLLGSSSSLSILQIFNFTSCHICAR